MIAGQWAGMAGRIRGSYVRHGPAPSERIYQLSLMNCASHIVHEVRESSLATAMPEVRESLLASALLSPATASESARVILLEELLASARAQVDYAQQRVAALEVEQRSLRAILGAGDGEGLIAAAGRVAASSTSTEAADIADRAGHDIAQGTGDAGAAAARAMIGTLVEIRDLGQFSGMVGVLREVGRPGELVTVTILGGDLQGASVSAYSVRPVAIGDRVRALALDDGSMVEITGKLHYVCHRVPIGLPFEVLRDDDDRIYSCRSISPVHQADPSAAPSVAPVAQVRSTPAAEILDRGPGSDYELSRSAVGQRSGRRSDVCRLGEIPDRHELSRSAVGQLVEILDRGWTGGRMGLLKEFNPGAHVVSILGGPGRAVASILGGPGLAVVAVDVRVILIGDPVAACGQACHLEEVRYHEVLPFAVRRDADGMVFACGTISPLARHP